MTGVCPRAVARPLVVECTYKSNRDKFLNASYLKSGKSKNMSAKIRESNSAFPHYSDHKFFVV